MKIRWFKAALEDVLFHQMVEQYLGASTDAILAGDGPERAESFMGRLVYQLAVDSATIALELAWKGNDKRHLQTK